MTSESVAVVIVTHNGRAHLDRCLSALLSQRTAFPFQVVLVDNASTDGSADHMRALYPDVTRVNSPTNLGFAGGNNLGIRSTTTELVVLLNDDTEVRPGWLSALVEAAKSEPEAGAISSKVLFEEPAGTIDSVGLDLLDDATVVGRGAMEVDRGQLDDPVEVFAACGNGMLLRRAALDEVGDFDEDFFAYFEDADLCWRMRSRGWKITCEPRAVLDHVHAATSVQWSPFYHFHIRRNRLLMLMKDARWVLVAAALTDLVGLSIRSGVRTVVRRISPRLAGPNWPTRAGTPTLFLVLGSLLVHLPSTLRKRRSIRRAAVVDDHELERWMQPSAPVYERPHRIPAGTAISLWK